MTVNSKECSSRADDSTITAPVVSFSSNARLAPDLFEVIWSNSIGLLEITCSIYMVHIFDNALEKLSYVVNRVDKYKCGHEVQIRHKYTCWNLSATHNRRLIRRVFCEALSGGKFIAGLSIRSRNNSLSIALSQTIRWDYSRRRAGNKDIKSKIANGLRFLNTRVGWGRKKKHRRWDRITAWLQSMFRVSGT